MRQKHGRPAGWAYTLGRRFAIFHCRRFGTFHFFFRTTFNAIRFHLFPLIFRLVVFYIKGGEYSNSPEVPFERVCSKSQQIKPSIFILG
jgi:hypothetical protein